jgi:hypothetical protein
MDIEVSRQAAVVEAVNGNVVVVKPDGSVRKLSVGDIVREDEIAISANDAGLSLSSPNGTIKVGANCIGCVDEELGWRDTAVAGEVNIDLSQAEDGLFTEADLATIQEAILAGADPTQILEAPGAGDAGGSVNWGFVNIVALRLEAKPDTTFETAGLTNDLIEKEILTSDDLTRSLGAQTISEVLTEGSIS